MAEIIPFRLSPGRRTEGAPTPAARSEVIIFPRADIRALRRMWGQSDFGSIVAGPDGCTFAAFPHEPSSA